MPSTKKASSESWKTHPVIAHAGTAVVTWGIVWNLAFPTHSAWLQNQNKSLREELATHQERAVTAETNNRALELELKETKAKLREFQAGALFTLGNPYPVGFGQIKIGDPEELPRSVFANGKIGLTDDIWSTTVEHPVFYRVAYMLDRSAPKRKVYMIYFTTHYSEEIQHLLQTKLIDALGQPSAGSAKDVFVWKTNARVVLTKERGSLTITEDRSSRK